MLAGRLRRTGRRAEIEPTLVRPQYAIVHLIHAALAIAGSVLATVEPAAGFALVLAVAASTYLDLNTRLYLVRSLLFRRASQNVVSPGSRPEAPVRLILSAHYDAARTGWVFSQADAPGRALRRAPRSRAPSGSSSGEAWRRCCRSSASGWPGIDATWLGALQSVPTILLIVAAFLLIDIALSDTVPGAYDNASGVAAVLSAAEQLEADPPANLDVWVVLPGSEESMCEGMRAFVRAHRKRARPGAHLRRQRRFGLPRRAQLRGQRGRGGQPAARRRAGRALRGALRRRRGCGDLAAAPLRYSLLDDALPAAKRRHSTRSRSAPRTAAPPPPGTTRTRTLPSASTRRRSPGRPSSSSPWPACSTATPAAGPAATPSRTEASGAPVKMSEGAARSCGSRAPRRSSAPR